MFGHSVGTLRGFIYSSPVFVISGPKVQVSERSKPTRIARLRWMPYSALRLACKFFQVPAEDCTEGPSFDLRPAFQPMRYDQSTQHFPTARTDNDAQEYK
jgi:hypothetical protein